VGAPRRNFPPEYLLPHVTRAISREWPPYIVRSEGPTSNPPPVANYVARVGALNSVVPCRSRMRDDFFHDEHGRALSPVEAKKQSAPSGEI